MSHKQNPPRQDRRCIGRSPVRDHAKVPSVNTSKPSQKTSILDRTNGEFSNGARPVETEA